MRPSSKFKGIYVEKVLYNTSLQNLPGEQRKTIQDFENYTVSNFGRIKVLSVGLLIPVKENAKFPNK